jgi:hypothetical protein
MQEVIGGRVPFEFIKSLSLFFIGDFTFLVPPWLRLLVRVARGLSDSNISSMDCGFSYEVHSFINRVNFDHVSGYMSKITESFPVSGIKDISRYPLTGIRLNSMIEYNGEVITIV